VAVSGSGTLGYVAPEQALGKSSTQPDVFSLGLILYQLFSGSLPEWPYHWPPPGIEKLKRDLHPDFIAFLRRAISLDQSKRFQNAGQVLAAFQRLWTRNRILSAAARRRRRTQQRGRDWKTVRQRQFVRAYRGALALRGSCRRCGGPTSERMQACPWCGASRSNHRGETRYPARCPRCGRGRKLDWRFCPWCYGPAFRRVSSREYTDRAYTGRCGNSRCSRKLLMPFMRYCPWCHRKVQRPWRIADSKHRCGRCGWGVLPDYWSFCAWCGKQQPGR
jgi:hypothetical protein